MDRAQTAQRFAAAECRRIRLRQSVAIENRLRLERLGGMNVGIEASRRQMRREVLSGTAGAVESLAMLRRAWLKIERWVLYNVILLCRIRGATERVARGFSLGLIVNFFPTFGFGVFISGFFARMFGGNMAAGIMGGGVLTFVWPILFFLNIQVGSVFQAPVVPLDELGDVTARTISTLVWGTTFAIGALINCLVVGLTVYFLLLLLYDRTRPKVLAWFRRHARDHQQRFRLTRRHARTASAR